MSSQQPAAPAQGLVTLAVGSGKGGVGKTNVVVNLAVMLARQRRRVAVLDADFGLGNVDVLLGLAPAAHVGHVLTGERRLDEIVLAGPEGVQIIPASSGLRELTSLTAPQWARLNTGLQRLTQDLDFLLIDTAAGIAENVLAMLSAADRVLVVTSPEPTSVVDAYALIKVLESRDAGRDVGLLVNGARDAEEAGLVFRQLDIAVTRFLNRRVHSYGFIVDDPAVRQAVCLQQPVVSEHPRSPASLCFRALASHVSSLGPNGGPGLRPLGVPDSARHGTPQRAPQRAALSAGDPLDRETPQCA